MNELLTEHVKSIFDHNSISKEKYMGVYSQICNFLMVDGIQNNAGGDQPIAIVKKTEVEKCSEIFTLIKLYLKEHLKAKTQFAFNIDGSEEFLNAYKTLWENYNFSSTVLNGIFGYINRAYFHWRKLAPIVGSSHVGMQKIYDVCLCAWKETVLKDFKNKIGQSILDVINKLRTGEMVNEELLRFAINSYILLGFEVDDREENPNAQIFDIYFEKDFLEGSKLFFVQKFDLIVTMSLAKEDILKHIEQILKIEEGLSKILPKNSFQKLITECEEVFIIPPDLNKLFLDEFIRVLKDDQNKNLLKLIYTIMARNPSTFKKLKEEYVQIVVKEGQTQMSEILDFSKKEQPTRFVNAILDVRAFHLKTIEESFMTNLEMLESANEGVIKFVNDNDLIRKTDNTLICSEFLAKHADNVMRNNEKYGKSTEEATDEIIIILTYLKDKNSFLEYYIRAFATRLISNIKGTDFDNETLMLAKLKRNSGYEFISKLQNMHQDINISKDLNKEFGLTKSGQEFSKSQVLMLRRAFWPFVHSNSESYLPPQFEKYIQNFEQFYQAKHNNSRKVQWIYSRCKAEIQLHNFDKPYIFQVKLNQLPFIMLFNDKTEYSVLDITLKTKTEMDETITVLKGLIKSKLLQVKVSGNVADEYALSPGFEDFTTSICLNTQFKSKKINHNICSLSTNMAEIKRENENVKLSIDKSREYAIQAAIMRILKARKYLGFTHLVTEVINQLKDKYKIEIKAIENSLDKLVELNFIEKDTKRGVVYKYIA